MSSYLVCSSPIGGHVDPMLHIAEHLAGRGHRVTMLTGSRFRSIVEAAQVAFRPLVGIADFDDRDTASYLPDRDRYPAGIRRAQYDIRTIFVDTIPAQAESVRAALQRDRPDAVLADNAFAGVLPLIADDDRAVPPLIAIGVLPLAQTSRDVAPQGMGLPPARGVFGRIRNRALNLFAQRVLFAETQQFAELAFAAAGAAPPRYFVMDASRQYERFLQLNAPEFEYPRSDRSANLEFIGALPPRPSTASLPARWTQHVAGRPVVHVTQGTIDNGDLGRLIRPTLEALADEDVFVVATTGGRTDHDLPVPSNALVVPWLPYDKLLPLIDVMVTNGGFGGVQQALGNAVPLVVAGDTEDKPDVAARVAYSGAGIDLRTGTPQPDAIRDAVRALLREPQYRLEARLQSDAIRRLHPFERIEDELEAAIDRRQPTRSRRGATE